MINLIDFIVSQFVLYYYEPKDSKNLFDKIVLNTILGLQLS